MAAVQRAPGSTVGVEELRALCAEQVASYKVPDEIRLYDALPRGPLGKVARAAVAELFGAAGPAPAGRGPGVDILCGARRLRHELGPLRRPVAMVPCARAAEALGYGSLWVGEHVILPDPRVPPSPLGPRRRHPRSPHRPRFLAGATERVRLGTGIVILPQRNPVVLAKELASLDVVAAAA